MARVEYSHSPIGARLCRLCGEDDIQALVENLLQEKLQCMGAVSMMVLWGKKGVYVREIKKSSSQRVRYVA